MRADRRAHLVAAAMLAAGGALGPAAPGREDGARAEPARADAPAVDAARVDAARVETLRVDGPRPDPAAPARLVLARELLAALDPSRTAYRHASRVWFPRDGAPAIAMTDCSGLLNALLARTDPRAWAALRDASPRGRPQAIDYVAAIGRGDAFVPIEHADAIAPGDVFAIAYPPDADDTGHVMLVDAVPRPFDGPPRLDGATQFALAVIDATATPHGADDPRAGPPPRTGVGRGVVRLYVDDDGVPVAHAWSRSPRARLRGVASRPIAIGRPR
ncbi:MAG: hypothetical protein O9345_13410 [Burkholderiaceae bacterium]|jgi:hypothetical protein|nr:hypothetical protein [Burkholderiales bacterium]MCZ8339126.1 hypothetical protein [Burkholderiaceae bacterium]